MIEIISISGLDGSGKSTQVRLLTESWENEGKKVYYFHAVQFSIAQSITNAVRKLRGKKASKSGAEKAVVTASWFSIVLRKIFLLIDIVRFRRLVRQLDSKGYDILISDRYFYDGIVNIAFLSNRESFMRAPIRKPDHSFYLKASPKLIMRRDEAPEQGLSYLESKKTLYDLLAKKEDLTVVNGDKDKQTVFRSLVDHMSENL